MIRAKVYGLIGVLMGLLGGIQARAEATIAYYHTDHLGSVRMLTDSQGAVMSVYEYFPYGENTTPTPNNRLKFTGQLRDHESGLDYFGARYYVNASGRWISTDPVQDFRKNILDPQRWNLYAYVSNNPLRYVDPDGAEQIAYELIRNQKGTIVGIRPQDPFVDRPGANAVFGGVVGILGGGILAAAAPQIATALGYFAASNPGLFNTTTALIDGLASPAPSAAGLSAGTGSRLLAALRSSDAAAQLEGKVGSFLASKGLLTDFGRKIVSAAGNEVTQIDAETAEFVVEVTRGSGKGKLAQAAKQATATGKQVIIFGTNLPKGFINKAKKQGVLGVTSLEELESIVRGQR